ncbi:MAG: DUF3108 domain-containing protein [Bacteroidota bacterium]|nr:DUF3108 domain-containing protein [Bacteroidota bacterium]
MKQLFLTLLLGLLVITQLPAQQLRSVKNASFARGEKLDFKVYYHSAITGNVTAGYGDIYVTEDNRKFNNRDTYHIIATGRSSGFFNMFFKVDDRFESYVDEEGIFPWLFTRRTREGGYKKDDEVNFYHFSGSAVSRKAITHIPVNVQDIISAFYFARTFNANSIKPGDIINLPFFLDDSVYYTKVKFFGRETITTSLGRIKCLKLKPMMAKGKVFKEDYPMTLWVSDDNNKIPILAESAVIVGSVKMELIKFSGLLNPFSSREGYSTVKEYSTRGDSTGKVR